MDVKAHDKELEILGRLCYKFDDKQREKLGSLILENLDSRCQILNGWITYYRDSLKSLLPEKKFNIDICMGGLYFFFASIYFTTVETEKLLDQNQVSTLFDLTSLYILLDYYIDDKGVNSTEKSKSIKRFSRLLLTVIEMVNIQKDTELHKGLTLNPDKLLESIGDDNNNTDIVCMLKNKVISLLKGLYSFHNSYEKLSTCINRLYKIYLLEIDSMKVQSKSDLTDDIYLNICLDKGGYTLECIYSVLGIEIKDRTVYDLGALCQIIDDVFDIDKDIDSGITTYATKKGLLDEIFYDFVKRVDALPHNFNIHKPILIMCLLYHMSYSDRYSSELKNIMKDFYPLKVYDYEKIIFNKIF